MVPEVAVIVRGQRLVDLHVTGRIVVVGPVYHLPAFLLLYLYVINRVMHVKVQAGVRGVILYQYLKHTAYLGQVAVLKALAKYPVYVLTGAGQLVLYRSVIVQRTHENDFRRLIRRVRYEEVGIVATNVILITYYLVPVEPLA